MARSEIAKIIHPFQDVQADVSEDERRVDPRWSYPVIQLVAFHGEDDPVTKEMLQAVRCNDISLGGISFFLPSPPASKHCTLVLGRAPRLMFIRAMVVHCQATGASLPEWIVGCQFLQKVDSLVD
jgi:hypothetical protein